MTDTPRDIDTLAKGGRTNIAGFILRLAARIPFLFIAGRLYGPDLVGRFALAIVVVELAALLATLGLKRGLAQALSETDRPHVDVVFDALAVALIAAVIASAVLIAFPHVMYPDGDVVGFERFLPCIIVASTWSDVTLAALAYRHNVKASVTARAIVEPWTISTAALLFSFVSLRDGLILSYVVSMLAALIASMIPFLRSYGRPHGWHPHPEVLFDLARRNAPLAGADAIEWGTRNVDRFLLGMLFAPSIVGIYYMAQQVASIPQKLKTSFDPILGPVITQSLANGDRPAIARQVRQVAFWIIAAQAGLALMGSIPGEAVMGVVGPQFVAGTAALAFLLWAEVLASTGAVSETALVYMARHRNLLISAGVLVLQVVLSLAMIQALRSLDWTRGLGLWLTQFGTPVAIQAASVAIALLLAVSVGSLIKARFLARLTGAPVSPWRWPLAAAAAAAIVVGVAFTALPHRFEWAELIIGEPAIAAVYLFVLWTLATGPEDRALFGRVPPAEDATLPFQGAKIG